MDSRILKYFVVIPLVQPTGIANSQGQALQKSGTEMAAAKAETIHVQIGLKIFFGQTVISSQDKGFGVAGDDVQPVEQAGIGIVRLVLMGVALQRRDVAAVAVAANYASLGKRGLGEFFDGCPFDIRSDHHLEIERVA